MKDLQRAAAIATQPLDVCAVFDALADAQVAVQDLAGAETSLRLAGERCPSNRPDFELGLALTRARIAGARSEYGSLASSLAVVDDCFARILAGNYPETLITMLRTRFASVGRLQQDLALRSARTSGGAGRVAAIAAGLSAAEEWKSRSLRLARARRGIQLTPIAKAGALLSPTQVLIEYAETTSGFVAYVLTNQELTVVELPAERTEVIAHVSKFNELLRGEIKADQVAEVTRLGAWLFDKLLRPVVGTIESRNHLILVPTPRLESVPFNALIVEIATEAPIEVQLQNSTYVLDKFDTSRIPSLGLLGHTTVPRVRDGGFVAVFADPGSGARRTAKNDPEIPRASLPHARREAITLCSMIASARHAAEHVSHALTRLDKSELTRECNEHFAVFLGESATLAEFLTVAPQAEIICFATHAITQRGGRTDPAIVLRDSVDDDGLLGHDRIAQMDLKARTVFLCACETAVGAVVDADTSRSLAAAFVEAGADRAVATLWRVLDSESLELMSDFTERAVLRASDEFVSFQQTLREIRGKPAEVEGRGEPVEPTEKPRVVLGHPGKWAAYVFVGR